MNKKKKYWLKMFILTCFWIVVSALIPLGIRFIIELQNEGVEIYHFYLILLSGICPVGLLFVIPIIIQMKGEDQRDIKQEIFRAIWIGVPISEILILMLFGFVYIITLL
ncbi:hypothetical protein [Anaerorhabdus sp.]|uniref:hypothetical protein n=1 Tax=Anaerorhabdus sp. TaxID=1872524 RepID=UPI002FCC9CAE